MTNLNCTTSTLKVKITKNEKVTLIKAKEILKKSRRMIQQNNLTSVVVELDNAPRIDKSALDFFDRVLCFNSTFPVTIVNI